MCQSVYLFVDEMRETPSPTVLFWHPIGEKHNGLSKDKGVRWSFLFIPVLVVILHRNPNPDISRYYKKSMLEDPWSQLEKQGKRANPVKPTGSGGPSVDANEVPLDLSSDSDS